MGLTSLVKEN